jgi:hypothetical protein
MEVIKKMSPDPLEEQIEHILSLEPDFDDKGGIPPGRETIDRAIKYLSVIKDFFLKKGIELGEPELLPVANSSVDVYWKTEEYELLMNVPEEGDADYYFDGEYELKGKFGIIEPH